MRHVPATAAARLLNQPGTQDKDHLRAAISPADRTGRRAESAIRPYGHRFNVTFRDWPCSRKTHTVPPIWRRSRPAEMMVYLAQNKLIGTAGQSTHMPDSGAACHHSGTSRYGDPGPGNHSPAFRGRSG